MDLDQANQAEQHTPTSSPVPTNQNPMQVNPNADPASWLVAFAAQQLEAQKAFTAVLEKLGTGAEAAKTHDANGVPLPRSNAPIAHIPKPPYFNGKPLDGKKEVVRPWKFLMNQYKEATQAAGKRWSDEEWLIFCKTYLTGAAQSIVNSHDELEETKIKDVANFWDTLSKFFESPTAKLDAMADFLRIRQEDNEDLLAFSLRFQDEALHVYGSTLGDPLILSTVKTLYRKGIKDSLQNKLFDTWSLLATHHGGEDKVNLKQLIAETAAWASANPKKDYSKNRKQGGTTRQPYNGYRYSGSSTSNNANNSNNNNRATGYTDDPMEIDNLQATQRLSKLTPEEREKCKKEGKCFRCRKAGHLAQNCPSSGSKQQPQQQQGNGQTR